MILSTRLLGKPVATPFPRRPRLGAGKLFEIHARPNDARAKTPLPEVCQGRSGKRLMRR
jgi:hypothetical protein